MPEAVNAVKIREWAKRIPKSKVIYFCQVVIIYIVVIASLVNLSLHQENQALWSSLLSACIGYVLPAPQLCDDGVEDNESLLPNPTEQ